MTGARVAQHARRTVGAAAALHRHAELELQALEADRALLGGTMDVVIRDAAANADDHGNGLSVFCGGVSRSAHLRLQVVLEPDLGEQVDLGLEPVDVLLGVVEDVLQDLARDEVAHALAVRDRRP